MSNITEVFRKVDYLNHEPLLLLEFDKLQGYGVNGKVVGLDIVLKSRVEGDKLQTIVPIPSPLIERYKMMIQATMLNLKLDTDIMDEYQSVIGVYIRKVILKLNEAGERESWIYTLSDLGETAYYRVPEHVAVIYAITHQLPIQSESQVLLRKSIATALQSVNRYLNNHTVGQLEFLEILYMMIEQEEDNQEFLSELTDDELSNSLTRDELTELRHKVVALEKYEWAQRFTKIINAKDDEKE